MKPIRVLALDIDGVITDGTVEISTTGEERKAIAFQDVDAVRAALRLGFPIALITGEENRMVGEIASRFGVTQVIQGAKDKLAALKSLSRRMKIPLKFFCYVGDADRDAPALAAAGLGLAPANARPSAKAAADYVLANRGGHGAVAEAVSLILPRDNPATPAEMGVERVARIGREHLSRERDFLTARTPDLARIAEMIRNASRTNRKIMLISTRALEYRGRLVAEMLTKAVGGQARRGVRFLLDVEESLQTKGGEPPGASLSEGIFQRGDLAVALCGPTVDARTVGRLSRAKRRGARTILFHGGEKDLAADWLDVSIGGCATPGENLEVLAWEVVCSCLLEMGRGA